MKAEDGKKGDGTGSDMNEPQEDEHEEIIDIDEEDEENINDMEEVDMEEGFK